jgi:hypothetical protein
MNSMSDISFTSGNALAREFSLDAVRLRAPAVFAASAHERKVYVHSDRTSSCRPDQCGLRTRRCEFHDCVILLVITTVPERPIWLASVAQLTKVCGFIGRR